VTRDFAYEIDELRAQIDELKARLPGNTGGGALCAPAGQNTPPVCVGEIRKSGKARFDPALRGLLDRLEDECDESGDTGRVSYTGVFSSGGRQSVWNSKSISADALLKLIEDNTAEKVLRCIGSSDRLNILLALLKEPMSVAALVEKRGYNTTGQVYHHLKPLLAADLIAEDKNAAKGTYHVKPHRVQGIIMLLAGIRDMTDTQYTKGDWDAEIHNGAKMVDERYMSSAEETQKTIETFFATLEPLTLKEMPSREKRKLVVLRVIAERFEPGRRYGEKEVNEVLKSIHEDFVSIRRYLVDYGFIGRTPDCAEYWLI
jgi:hypothetical protein